MKPTQNDTDLRDMVSRAYASALESARSGKKGCCSTANEAGRSPAGVAAATAGYGQELDQVPEEAARASFGCGNPLAFSDVREGETVLDLGSGAGLDLFIASRKVGPEGQVIGVDMTDEMIDAARRNALEAGVENVEVRKGIIEQLPVEDGSVDWVISNCVINLSADKPAVFREIHRVLRPGGRFSISDIVVEEPPDWIRKQAMAYAACIGGAISEDAYRGGLEAAGLIDVDVTERLVYDAVQLRAMVGSDLEALGMSDETLTEGIAAVTGKAWSAKFVGRRPAV